MVKREISEKDEAVNQVAWGLSYLQGSFKTFPAKEHLANTADNHRKERNNKENQVKLFCIKIAAALIFLCDLNHMWLSGNDP